MPKKIEQLTDPDGHLVEFIWPCPQGKVLVRWFTNPTAFKTQQFLSAESARFVERGLLRQGYHLT